MNDKTDLVNSARARGLDILCIEGDDTITIGDGKRDASGRFIELTVVDDQVVEAVSFAPGSIRGFRSTDPAEIRQLVDRVQPA
ncbi:hypothetical protein ACIP5N_21840 [Streptomyces sp. NPDC088768]|uniref:hypothetical protein n=1 Tax=Streptomyces sp. NPDC088768 TaxID=3365894 RepID=UPI003804DF31